MASFLLDQQSGEQSEVANGEQRASIGEIQEMLSRVSLSPFHSEYKENRLPTDCFNGPDASASQVTQNGCQNWVNPFDHPVKNGFTSKPSNPFFTTNQHNELSSRSTNPFLPQSQDSNVSSDFENNNFLPSAKNSASHGQDNSWAHFPSSSTASLRDDWAIFPPLNLNGDANQTLSTNDSQATSFSRPFSDELTYFQPSSDKEEPSTSQKPEQSSNEGDYLLEYIMSKQKKRFQPTLNNSPSFLSTTDITDGFFTTPTPQSSANTGVQYGVLQSTPLPQTTLSAQNEMKPFSYLSDYSALRNDQFKPQETNTNKVDTPPGLTNGTLQTVVSSQNASADAELMPKCPPRPAPRTKAPKTPDQTTAPNGAHVQTPCTSTPAVRTSVSQVNTNLQDAAQAEQETNSQFYEDILLIGKEQCVEDWPEDSPMLSPDWMPAGKIKLRRDSFRFTEDFTKASKTQSLRHKTKIKSKRPSILSKKVFKAHDVVSEEVLSDKEEQNATVNKKSKHRTKLIVPHLSYRGAWKNSFTVNSPPESLQVFKDDVPEEPNGAKMRNDEKKDAKDFKPKEPLKYKLTVPHRHSEHVFEDDLKKNEMSFLQESKVDSQDEVFFRKRSETFTSFENSVKKQGLLHNQGGLQDCRPRKPVKFSVPTLSRRTKSTGDQGAPGNDDGLSKSIKVKGSDLNGTEDRTQLKKSPVLRAGLHSHKASKSVKDAGVTELFKSEERADAKNSRGKNNLVTKSNKVKTSPKLGKESKLQEHACFPEDIEPPGATSSNYYLSEAAKAEWMSSQMDVRRSTALEEDEEEERLGEVKEEEEGDTDSLMEWWNTVELWDELPSDEEISLKEDETKSFTEIADKVHRGLRVFYKLFTEQAEILYQHVLLLYAIGDDVSNFHRRTKIANITGSTTTAVGGVTAIAGLALAPFTLGASLIVSAVGLGVATAGGITAASAAISDNVHDMTDRKKIEVVAQDFETHLTDLRRCLSFVFEGVRRLRCHPLLRRNNYYAGDWEVRRALQTVSQVEEPVEHAEEIVKNAMVALKSTCTGMDKYFSKDSEVKKGYKKEVTIQVHFLAKLLQDSLVELNSIREQLMEATGQELV